MVDVKDAKPSAAFNAKYKYFKSKSLATSYKSMVLALKLSARFAPKNLIIKPN